MQKELDAARAAEVVQLAALEDSQLRRSELDVRLTEEAVRKSEVEVALERRVQVSVRVSECQPEINR